MTLLPSICFTSLHVFPSWISLLPPSPTDPLSPNLFPFFFTSESPPPHFLTYFSLDHTAIDLPGPNKNFGTTATEYLLGQELL